MSSALFSSNRENNDDKGDVNKSPVRQKLRSWIQTSALYKTRKLSVTAFVVAATSASFAAVLTVMPQQTEASAPVMALPKAEDRDPATEALHDAERRATARTQKELRDMAAQARKIEAEQGEGARIKFEKEFKQRQTEQALAKTAGLETLKRELLDQGIDPFTDMEGRRQLTLYENDVDLGEIQGTHWALEKEWEKSAPKRSMKYKKAANRQIIACMVQDMKNRGVDPLQYFEKHQDQTETIFDMAPAKANLLLQQYQANLEQYGQITVPAEGELSALEKLKASGEAQKKSPDAVKAAKAAAKEEAAAAKAAAAAAKAEAKAAAKIARAEAKELAEASKREAKAAKAAAVAGAAAASAAMGAAASSASGAATQTLESVTDQSSAAVEQVFGGEEEGDDYEDLDAAAEAAPVVSGTKSTGIMSKMNADDFPVVPAAAAVVVVAGGGYAFKLFRDKGAAEEEKRRRQFRMLMGEDADGKSPSRAPGSAPALEEVDTDLFGIDGEDSSPTPTPAKKKKNVDKVVVPEPIKTEAPAKKRMGLKNVFSKKSKDGRETKLAVLVGPDAKAFEFAKTLAKILTFGAPGRFPAVVGMSGGMPMEDFDLDKARQMLIDSQASEDLTLEESAEIFANVVNCMLIAIVDLASSSLKEKDEKLTVDAIKIVVDFMNHAASLYDSIAAGVSIAPVRYNGDLSKSKLEQMYGAYAASGMMDMGNMDEDFDAQVGLLCDVFQISEKKAEGIMMKAMQKNMMKMMESGEGAEGMEQMLKSMGGMEGMEGMKGMGGMPGMNGEEGDPDPEQLKEMLQAIKTMKDSGTLPPQELEQVKAQFRDSFGSSIDQVIKDADANGDEMEESEKELLGLIKSILDD